MDFVFNEEQEELRATARAFLAERSGSEQVRKAMESDLGYDPNLWREMAAELGWTSVTIPEAYDGLGLGDVELVALLEVMGESLVCSPFFATVALGANALLVAGSDEQKRAHLPGIAEGQTRVTLASAGPAGDWSVGGVEATFESRDDGYRLDGEFRYVLDGATADLIVVGAREAGTQGEHGIALFVIPAATAGLERTPLPTIDSTRRLAAITMDGVRVAADARLCDGGEAASALREILDRASIALAAEQVGGAQRCLDMAVAYANEREQFGRPIGSFQAIKHKCADMMVAVEAARSAVYYAGCVAAEGGAELRSAAAAAQATASDAFFRCAADSLQIHGGVGFTWEYDVHLYFKRAKSSESFLGSPQEHRELVAREIGL